VQDMDFNQYEKLIFEQTKELSKQNELNKYININLEELDFIKKNIGLSVSEKEFLLDIMNHISVGTNVIINQNNEIATQLEIAELLNINTRSLQRKFNSLIEKKIIYMFKDWNKSYYIINPYLYFRGFCINDVYVLFNEFGYRKSLNNKVVKINDKSFVITKEKVLETLISNNLNQIEEGLTLIKTQYEVDNGFIDILAKDNQGITTIIEIKIKKDDPKLVEQCVYYPTQFEEQTRIITIAPTYSNKLYSTLSYLGYVEIKNYYIEDNCLKISDFKNIS
jgi:Holliday junction resolvase-like predicted endonuclease